MKMCSNCHLLKEEFYTYSNGTEYAQCKDCIKSKNRITHHKTREVRVVAMRKSHLKRTYGLTLEQFDDLVEKQNGRCAICRKEQIEYDCGKGPIKNLHVDHDHATGKVRGLLCHHCNRGLGMFKDDPYLVSSALSYLGNS